MIPQGYKQTEVGVIPLDWEVAQIGEVASKVGSGITPTGGERVYKREGRPFLRSQNVGWGGLLLDDVAFIDDAIHYRFADTEIKNGDVLLNITGASIGRSAVADARVSGGNVNQHVCIIRSDQSRLVPRYLKCIVLSSLGQRQIDSFQAGGNRQGLNFAQVRSIRLPLPPLTQQLAISEALSDFDALLGALDRLIAKKRDLKQAAMQQLLTGQTRLPGFTGEWEVKRLGDCLVSRPSYGINAAAVPRSDRLPTYVRITDITEEGQFVPDPRVSVAASNAGDFYLREGDIVFARTGASVGKSYLYHPNDGELVFAGFLIKIRPDPDFLVPKFLAAVVATGEYWNWVRLMSMRSGQPGINGNEFAQLPLCLPPTEEQAAIAEVLFEMDSELAVLEERSTKTRALKQAMMQELLTGKTRLL